MNNPMTPLIDDAKAVEAIVGARIRMLIKSPFWGNLATRLQLERSDDWCPTAATDGRKFYYNPEFILKLGIKELEFLFGHELLHVAYDHMGRRGTRDPVISNIAADYVVNNDLIEFNIGEPIKCIELLHDKKYKGWSYEQVYDDLIKNAKQINISALAGRVLDQHPDGSGQDGQPELSEGEMQEIRDEFREAMLSAAEAVGADNVPAGVKRLLKDITEPKLDWRQILQQQVDSLVKADFTFAKPSRRSWHADAILPSRLTEKSIDVTVALDMSGSIGPEQIRDFFGELSGIMSQFAAFTIGVMSFDTKVYNYQVFTEDTAEDLMKYEPQGGGGTDFNACWEFMKDEGIQPKFFCMFTDGYPCGSWGDPDYCETMFLINNGGHAIMAPFGLTVQYEK